MREVYWINAWRHRMGLSVEESGHPWREIAAATPARGKKNGRWNAPVLSLML
jgi:hypothetical protein